ncbi:MAG: Yip1 family protein [Nitrospira sp.]|nr:Yip1 family protein [Nitrospira sp.]
MRAKNMLLQPKVEWATIEPEHISAQALYTGYIIPLAAIGPVAMLIGMSIIGVEIPSIGTVQLPLPTLLPQIVIGYGLGLAAVYVLALIINALAPTFGGKSDRMQALKVAAYGATASWVGGVFHLVPTLGILGLLAGCYTLYLFYLGLPILMKSPPERSLGYTITVMVSAIALAAVVGLLSAVFVEFPASEDRSPSELPAPQDSSNQ